jgi:sulfide:quinone oxidoreductase
MSEAHHHRLVIAGAGIAGLEALAALSAVAQGRLDVTVLSPQPEFKIQASSVEEPFARPRATAYSVPAICADLGATHVADELARVETDSNRVFTARGDVLDYDSLLVAIGAPRQLVLENQAIVFRGDQDAEAMLGLIQDVEGGYAKRVVFVVPSGVTWPLPLYELALMTAHRAREMGRDDVSLVVITPEELPLAVFGQKASAAVGRALDEAGVEVMTGTYVDRISSGSAHVSPSGELVPVGRVVTVPRLSGPYVRGLAADDYGFIRIDGSCRVDGTENVYAAGDGTTFPVKQGGVAAQQADAAAMAIARRAGADVDAQPFDPVLRAKLLTGSRAEYLREALGPDAEETSTASGHALWWPPSKVAAPYLAGYLEGLPLRTRGDHPPAIHSQGDPSGGVELLGE